MSPSSDPRLPVHSAVEASLYLLVTPCPNCGNGPVRANPSNAEPSGQELHSGIDLPGRCDACRATWRAKFRLADDCVGAASRYAGGDEAINPTARPSTCVDVCQWITLCRMLSADAEADRDRVRARRLKVLAGCCIDEALKFYTDAASDLPPAAAFFSDSTRGVFRENPHEFARDRLLALRASLPIPIPKPSQ